MVPVALNSHHRSWCSLLSGAILALLVGCGTVPLDAQPPAEFNLSGQWALDTSVSSPLVDNRGASFRSGFMIQDFPLLVTRNMRIEQDARSMGIEYEKGSYRDVTWGDRRRGIWEVRAGWYEGDLHIYSKAPDTSATEIWHLSEDGQQLDISIEVRGERTRNFERSFRRSAGL